MRKIFTALSAALLLTTAAQAEIVAVSVNSYPGVIELTDSPCPKGPGLIAIFSSRITKESATGCWIEVGETVVIGWKNIGTKKSVYEYPSGAFLIK